MAWIESHTVLLRHRKVLQLAEDLAILPVYTIGHLHALWHTVLEQQEDGDLSDWSDSMIAHAAAYSGDATHFVQCLQVRKWLDGKVVHDWLEHAGRYLTAKYRTLNPLRLKKIYSKHKVSKKSVSSQTKVRSESDNLTKPNLPNQTEPNLTKPSSKDCDVPSAAARVWDRYESEYLARYQTKPVRNAKVNGQIAALIKRIGIEAAPEVAAFYVWHNDQFYVRSRHPVGLLLHAAEGLHTQWKTGVKSTTSEVKQAEFQDDAREQVKRVELMLARGL